MNEELDLKLTEQSSTGMGEGAQMMLSEQCNQKPEGWQKSEQYQLCNSEEDAAQSLNNLVNKLKSDMLNDDAVWAYSIEHSFTRGVKPSMLMQICTPEFRKNIIRKIETGRYRILPPRIAEIPKDDGGTRQVYVNSNQDRVVLNVILYIYQTLYSNSIHKNCVSYQKGMGVAKICTKLDADVKQMKRSAKETDKVVWGCKLDIKKYFDSVPRDQVMKCLGVFDTGSPIDKLVEKYYLEDMIEAANGQMEIKFKSIAQGCALSAFLANVVLRDLDEAMSKCCEVYYRYSDDIVFFSKDILEPSQVLTDGLAQVGLQVHPNKLELIEGNNGFEFLGVKFKDGKLKFGDKFNKNFKSTVGSCCKKSKQRYRNEEELKRTIRKLKKKLFSSGSAMDSRGFCWSTYAFSVCNDEQEVIRLDNYAKECLRQSYTGKWNYTHNVHQMPNEKLKELGWVSLHHLYKVYCLDEQVYKLEVKEALSNAL